MRHGKISTWGTQTAQGNGFLIRDDWKVVDLWNGERLPTPLSVQISEPSLFLGDRETERRCLTLVRVKHRESDEGLILGCTHLTVLRDEHGKHKCPEKSKKGSEVRKQQVENLLRIVDQLSTCIPIILAGDFNAEQGSSELRPLEEEGFIRVPNDVPTHCTHNVCIDHIWFRPQDQLQIAEYSVIDGLESATDHRPVFARLNLGL